MNSLIQVFLRTIQESTNFTPFELMFGRKATLPIDIEMIKQTGGEKISRYVKEGEEIQTSLIEQLISHRKKYY